MPHDMVIATFDDHKKADAAVSKLIEEGFDMSHFSVVGKGYHTEEKIIGFYNLGERMKLWGKYGAFWGGLWGVLVGGAFFSLPVIGPVVVLGPLALAVVAVIEGALEGAVVIGGLTALGAAFFSFGIPKDSVIRYETAVKADGFIVSAHGPAAEIERARAVLHNAGPSSVDVHRGLVAGTTEQQLA
jgi:hypothetical protein